MALHCITEAEDGSKSVWTTSGIEQPELSPVSAMCTQTCDRLFNDKTFGGAI